MQTWLNCISEKRKGKEKNSEFVSRTHFQRDYDRLIFSSAFRRLQNKTQVFPLPGNTFVHNRLTHSLEVASVGRSLGSLVGESLAQLDEVKSNKSSASFYNYDLPSVIASACLAHDMGNPPFGHSGEKAISSYFIENKDQKIGHKKLCEYFNQAQWEDLIHFEGNANAFRILNHSYNGKSDFGMQLTYTTLASILKYPCEARAVNKSFTHRKKFGFFQSDLEDFFYVVSDTNMIKDIHDDYIIYKRHPFVYLVEAADDICYSIIDMEDAHRVKIMPTKIIKEAFLNLLEEHDSNHKEFDKIISTLNNIDDANESISYLRAKCINTLVLHAVHLFMENKDSIIGGTWNSSLMKEVTSQSKAVQHINKISKEQIYEHSTVIEVEIAGYKVMSELLETFVVALLEKGKELHEKTLKLIPAQYHSDGNDYEKILNIVDFVAGMTDGYAMEMYRKFKGIEIASHR